MPVVLLGVAAVALVAFLAARGGGAPRARVYTKADGPDLRRLKLLRAGMGNQWTACMNNAKNSKSTLDVYVGSIAGAAALLTGALTLDPAKGVAVLRATTKGYGAARAASTPCKAEYDRLTVDLAEHDALCAKLGFPPDVAQEAVDAAWMSIGGDNFDATSVAAPKGYATATGRATLYYAPSENRLWNTWVKAYGIQGALTRWNQGDRDDNGELVEAVKPPPPYDPATGIAIDPATGKPAAEFSITGK